MLRIEQHGDVTRLHFASVRSRLVGYSVSAYLVRGVLVDTGFPAVREDVAAVLESRRPRGVIVTHHHEDHAGNIELVASRGIPIAASAATIDAVRDPATMRVGVYRRYTWGTMTALRSSVVPFGAAPLAMVPAPGHSVDHHIVWDADQRTLFSGDLFLGV